MTRIKNPDLTLPSVRRALVLAVLAGVVTFTACSDSTPAAVEPATDSAIGAGSADEAFKTADEMPELVGGLNSLARSIVYPEGAKKEGVQGRVLVQFIVEKDGTVSNAEVVRGVDERLDAEAIRAVENIEFKPGRTNGEPVRVQMTLPISFKLD